MHENLNVITEKIIGCAIQVHKTLGPGLLETIYESAMCVEFDEANISYEKHKYLPVVYREKNIGLFKIDIVVENKIVADIKSTERMDPLYHARLLSNMKLGNYKLGLLINFNNNLLKDGIKRFIL